MYGKVEESGRLEQMLHSVSRAHFSPRSRKGPNTLYSTIANTALYILVQEKSGIKIRKCTWETDFKGM